jgi:P27 family predicted phage terminase small subunit
MKGRKRLPEEELKARGTKRPDRHDNRLEAEPLDQIPPPPSGLTKEGKAVWVDTCQKLIALKILSDQDRDVIEQYCIAVVTARKAARDIEENGYSLENDKGGRYTNPALAALKQSWATMLSISDRFGFSPYARQKLKAETKSKEKQDPLAALFGKN